MLLTEEARNLKLGEVVALNTENLAFRTKSIIFQNRTCCSPRNVDEETAALPLLALSPPRLAKLRWTREVFCECYATSHPSNSSRSPLGREYAHGTYQQLNTQAVSNGHG